MGAAERMSDTIGSSRTVNVMSSSIPDLLGVPQLEFVRAVGREALSEPFTYMVDLRLIPLAADQSMLEFGLDAAIDHEMTLLTELDGIGASLFGGVGAGT